MSYLKLIRISFDKGLWGTLVVMVIFIWDSQKTRNLAQFFFKIKQLLFNDFLYLLLNFLN